eukprot:1734746-Amphidinium_carterae.1
MEISISLVDDISLAVSDKESRHFSAMLARRWSMEKCNSDSCIKHCNTVFLLWRMNTRDKLHHEEQAVIKSNMLDGTSSLRFQSVRLHRKD